jgi:ketosteroid isomerase-like protein
MKVIQGRWLLLALLASGIGQGHAQTVRPATSSASEPVAVVEAFFKALAAADFGAATALLDAEALIFESGGVERSRAEYASHHMKDDASFLQAATQRVLSRSTDARGELAWVATESRLTTAGAKPADIISTETMVLRRSSDGWRIVHIHWSSRKAPK